jgi:hypothetical protein
MYRLLLNTYIAKTNLNSIFWRLSTYFLSGLIKALKYMRDSQNKNYPL